MEGSARSKRKKLISETVFKKWSAGVGEGVLAATKTLTTYFMRGSAGCTREC